MGRVAKTNVSIKNTPGKCTVYPTVSQMIEYYSLQFPTAHGKFTTVGIWLFVKINYYYYYVLFFIKLQALQPPNVVLRNDNEGQLHRENVFKARGCLFDATFLKRCFYRQ